ncbi:hypothetical protein OG871_18710 [Kitasatospora sp. NBC_00374]|uniref:hypothetical protein n=1 Tax=Kitasatospora sp. NBC_00374 TaxID=2975964 RepID=UPI0030E46048
MSTWQSILLPLSSRQPQVDPEPTGDAAAEPRSGPEAYGVATWEEVDRKLEARIAALKEQERARVEREAEAVRRRAALARRRALAALADSVLALVEARRLADPEGWRAVVEQEQRRAEAWRRTAHENAQRWAVVQENNRRAAERLAAGGSWAGVGYAFPAPVAEAPWEPAIQLVYLVEHRGLRAVKIGIGSSGRILEHVRNGWRETHRSQLSRHARRVEAAVLERVRSAGIPPFLTQGQMPQAGWTETMDSALISADEVWAMVAEEYAALERGAEREASVGVTARRVITDRDGADT